MNRPIVSMHSYLLDRRYELMKERMETEFSSLEWKEKTARIEEVDLSIKALNKALQITAV